MGKKCRNCGNKIKEFEGKWWHYQKEELPVTGFEQESHILFKIYFYPNAQECLKPVPKQEKK